MHPTTKTKIVLSTLGLMVFYISQGTNTQCLRAQTHEHPTVLSISQHICIRNARMKFTHAFAGGKGDRSQKTDSRCHEYGIMQEFPF